ncbi:MAG: DNA repair protein RecN [Thermodesulfobacteriota bacterium]
MLSELHIENLAIIKELTLEFKHGFTVLTGETGAGKSIILQAIHLLSGGKATAKLVRSGTEQAIVEALFEISDNSPVRQLAEENSIDCDDTLILKRILSAKGRSRFYVNNSMTTAKVVGMLSEYLLSVASQHDHQQLLSSRAHLDFVDAAGDLLPLRQTVTTLYETWSAARQKLTDLQGSEQDKEQRKDFLQYQIDEIEKAALVDGEEERLQDEKNRLRSSTELTKLASDSFDKLYSITDSLAVVRKNLEQAASLDPLALTISEAVAEQSYLLEDQRSEIRHYMEAIPHDPGRLEEVTERLDTIAHLKRKYGATIGDILLFLAEAREEHSNLESLDQEISETQILVKNSLQDLEDACYGLSSARKKAAGELATAISMELKSLCLENSCFEIAVTPQGPSRTGMDHLDFLFSANFGETVKPLSQVASGGELSRLLLGLKCVLAKNDQVETVIFDEVDSGISGKAAESVGTKIRELACHHQVLCITHLAQIASLADDHFQVSKSIEDDRTVTTIQTLEGPTIHGALAAMLDGNSVTDSTLAYVQQLVERKTK